MSTYWPEATWKKKDMDRKRERETALKSVYFMAIWAKYYRHSSNNLAILITTNLPKLHLISFTSPNIKLDRNGVQVAVTSLMNSKRRLIISDGLMSEEAIRERHIKGLLEVSGSSGSHGSSGYLLGFGLWLLMNSHWTRNRSVPRTSWAFTKDRTRGDVDVG